MVLLDSDYPDVANIVDGGEVAEEEVGHECLLGLPVLPQQVILELLHQLPLHPQERTFLLHS